MAREPDRSPPPPEPYLYQQPDSQRHHHRSSYQPSNTHQPVPGYERPQPLDTSSVQNEAYISDPARYQQTRQPIDDAVDSAVRGTENVSAISPEIINQISSQVTANVIHQLRAANLPPFPNFPPSANNAGDPTSPAATGSPQMEHRNVHTPPSPTRPS